MGILAVVLSEKVVHRALTGDDHSAAFGDELLCCCLRFAADPVLALSLSAQLLAEIQDRILTIICRIHPFVGQKHRFITALIYNSSLHCPNVRAKTHQSHRFAVGKRNSGHQSAKRSEYQFLHFIVFLVL